MNAGEASTAAMELDEASRPAAPAIAGVTPEQRRHGRRLAAFHRMHLAEMDRTRRAMEAVEAGGADPASLVVAVAAMRFGANLRVFGTLCGRECQMLTFHHTIEDQTIFPLLHARGSDGLRKVVERLQAEHLVIHALIDELAGRAADAVAQPSPEAFAALRATFETLDRTVRSHFGYEETQLEDALGVYAIEL